MRDVLEANDTRAVRATSTNPRDMSISQNGISLIEGFEGLVLHAYQDHGGVWTIGYGHTGPDVHPGETITAAQAQALLKNDLGWAQAAVRDNVHVPLTQNQFDALVSLTYNLGSQGYPTLLNALNSGNYAAAQQDFHLYVHDRGSVLPGLVARRDAEANLFGNTGPGGTVSRPTPGGTRPTPGGNRERPSSTHDYTVRSGDTLWSIAANHHVSLAALEAANPQIANPNEIRPGQIVHIPGRGHGHPRPVSHDYTVQSGDTLSGIAAQNGISLQALENANPQIANPNFIYVGQLIHIPGAGQSTPAHPRSSHDYTVRSGDTLSSIAARRGVTLSALEAANPQITNPNVITPGQIIRIPGGNGVASGEHPISRPHPTPPQPSSGHASTNRAAIYMAQPNGWSCAATSLTMALAAWGVAPSNGATWQSVVNSTGDNSSEGLPGNASLLGPTAERYGLHATFNPAGNATAVRAALAQGHTVIFNGSLGVGGHFVYIAGLNANGTFNVFDPAGRYTSMTDAQLNAFSAAGSHPQGFEEIWK